MKTFEEIRTEQLNEGKLRTGSIGSLAAKSMASGKKADRALKQGLSAMNAPSDKNDPSEQLEKVLVALTALLEAQRHMSQQIKTHIALDAIGHLANKKPRH